MHPRYVYSFLQKPPSCLCGEIAQPFLMLTRKQNTFVVGVYDACMYTHTGEINGPNQHRTTAFPQHLQPAFTYSCFVHPEYYRLSRIFVSVENTREGDSLNAHRLNPLRFPASWIATFFPSFFKTLFYLMIH